MFCVDICFVCFLCSCSVCSSFDSALLSCRLLSGVNLLAVAVYWSVIVVLHKLLFFGLFELFLDDIVVHSFVVVCSLHVFSGVMIVGTSLCRISMIALADSNSSSTLFS